MKLSQLPHSRNLLFLALLLLLCIYTALASLSPAVAGYEDASTLHLTKAHYAGFVAVAACFLSYSTAPRFFRRALGVTLLLAVFGLVNFLPIAISVGLTLNDAPVGINPFSLLLLAVFCFLNRAATNAFIRRNLLPPPTPKQAANHRREAIDQFKQTFARKTDDSLQQIVRERKLVGDAIVAAQELLQERNTPAASP